MRLQRYWQCLLAAALFVSAHAGIHATAHGQDGDDSEPSALIYQFEDPNPWARGSVYSVYQDADVTAMTHHAQDEAPEFDAAEWFAAEETGERLVQLKKMDRPVLVESSAGDFEEGDARRATDGEGAVAFDDVDTSLERTGERREIAGREVVEHRFEVRFEQERTDADGQADEETHAYDHRLWIAEDLPHSPAFTLPFRQMDRAFVAEDAALGEYVVERLADEIGDEGLVLGVEFRQEGADEAGPTLEAERVERVDPREVRLPDHPVVDRRTFEKVGPATVVSRVLEPTGAAELDESRFELNGRGAIEQTLEGASTFGVNEQGDFSLLLKGTLDGEEAPDDAESLEVFLLLMRPMHGEPDDGAYRVADAVDDIEGSSREELEERSEHFNVMAVFRKKGADSDRPDMYAFVEVEKGTVETQQEEAGLTGELSLELTGVELSDDTDAVDLELDGEFRAVPGLENVGSSRITQVLSR